MPDASIDSSNLGSYADAVAKLIKYQGETAYIRTGLPGSTTPSIDLSAPKPYAYTDCSGWVDYALNSLAPLHAAVLGAARQEHIFNQGFKLQDGTPYTLDEKDQPWSRADVLATTLSKSTAAGANGFAQIKDFGSLQAGDVVAYATGVYALLAQPDPGSSDLAKIPTDTGHTMIVTGAAVAVPDADWDDGSGHQPDDIVKVWALPVVDSSNIHHFRDLDGYVPPVKDSRDFKLPDNAPDGAEAGGLGQGTMWFGEDAQGNVTHFRFAKGDPWIPNTTGKASDDKALLIAAVRPVAGIDLKSAFLVNGTLPVQTYPNAQSTVGGTDYAMAETLTGHGNLAVSGGGVLHLAAGNSFVGTVSLSEAKTTVMIDGDTALGADGNALVLGKDTVLHLAGSVQLAHSVTVSGTAKVLLDSGSSSVLSGSVSGGTLVVSGGGTLALKGDMSKLGEVWAGGTGTSLMLDSAETIPVVRLDAGTALSADHNATVDKLVVEGTATLTITTKAKLTVSNGLHQTSGATGMSHVTVAGDGSLVLKQDGSRQMTLKAGSSLYTGTLAELNGATLSTYKLNDVIDVTDLDALKAANGGVIAKYDATNGQLILRTVDGTQSATLTVPAGLTTGSFAVRTDGDHGSYVSLATPLDTKGATALHATGTGFTGKGITIGLISNSLNALGGLAQDIQNGLLGADTTVLNHYAGDSDDEGRSMAQIIHAIAPDAKIVFASASTKTKLAGAIDALVGEKVNVIVDDIDDYGSLMWGTDSTVDTAVEAAAKAGITLLTSAGNTGANYYERSSYSLTESHSKLLGDAMAFNFSLDPNAPQYFQKLNTATDSASSITVTLGWNDASGNLDMNVFQLVGNDGLLQQVPVLSDELNKAGTVRTIIIPEVASKDLWVAITGTAGASTQFKYIIHGDGYSDLFKGNADANLGSGAISGHALDPAEITVGAVAVKDALTNGAAAPNETFSAPGATALDADGNPVTLNGGKPDVSGVDGAPSNVNGTSDTFSGTSAAAPSLAGVVALMLQANANLTPAQVKAALKASATPTPTPLQGGAGLVDAAAALALVTPPQVTAITAATDGTPGWVMDGHVVTLTLTTNTAVTVSVAADGSLPTLALDDGGVATFDPAASDGTSLVFRYTVTDGQSTSSLNVVSLLTNGAVVQNNFGVQNGLALSLADTNTTAVAGAQTGVAVGPDPLFDAVFYLAHNPDVAAAGVAPYQHYMTMGWHESRDPDAYFQTQYYLKQNPDVAAAGVNPLQHFESSGWKEGRNPSAVFDDADYLAANPDVKAAGIDPLLHYVQSGKTEGRAAFGVSDVTKDPLVDAAYYYAQNPDVRAAGVDANTHYLAYGWQEGRNPNTLFDTNYYLTQNPDVRAAGINPLQHFEVNGYKEGRQPSLLFNDAKYLAVNPDVKAADVDPLLHYLNNGQFEGRQAFLSGATAAADPLVNATFYDAQLGATLIPGGMAGQQQAAWSYDATGWQQGLNPDALFDTAYYLSHNPDVAAAHINPLLHYEQSGWLEGRNPSAAFNGNAYLQHNPDVAAAGMDPLLHYVAFGATEGRAIYAVT